MSARILVVAALAAELAPLCRRLDNPRRQRLNDAHFVAGTIAGRDIRIGWTGDGAGCARRGLVALLAVGAVERILVVGVAGGLSPELDADAVVAARAVVEGGGDLLVPPPDGRWLVRLEALPGVVGGTLLSSSRIAITVDEKAALWRGIGAPVPATVDLETATYARIAAASGVPYQALRAITDTAAETLPLDFNRLRDRDGRVRPLAVAARALVRPSLIQPLRKLQRRLVRAAERLADCAVAAIAEVA